MAEADPTALCFAGFTLDPAARTLMDASGREIPLRRSEYELLRAFLAAPGRALSRDHLLDAVAGRHSEPFDRSVDVLVGQLRRKIEPEPGRPRLIVTVPGVGYRFAARPRPASAESATVLTPEPPTASPAAPERRQLTVLHCGLSGPALLSARRDPEDLQRLLTAFHTSCAAVLHGAGGTVDRLLSDGLVAYFGYPQADEHQAERAIRAALQLVAAAGRVDTGQPGRLQLRLGVATGLAVVGGQSSGQPTALGEPASIAAGLASRAEPGSVLISASTRRLVGELFELRSSEPTVLEEAGQTVEVWQVTGEGAAGSRFEALRGAKLAPLVGREEELELLLRRWAQAKAGGGRVVLVSGEPGIGKSRLARAFQDAIAGEPHVELRFFCSPHHQDSALYPHVAQLGRAAGFARDDTDAARLAKLDAVLAQSDATDEAVALTAELLSIGTDQRERIQQMTPQARRERTLAALLAQLAGLAARQPVLMIYEDVHWIDPSSRELLERTIERLEHLPVLLVTTFRPEFQPPWAGQANVTSLALTRLDRRDTTAMIAGIAGAKGLPAGVAQEIAEHTDGVPLFVEETTKAVMESGPQAVETSSSIPHPALAVPATLHASLSARLDRLGPVARDVAQKGAVIGREFGYDLLASVADLPEPQLQEALDRLVSSGLLFTRGIPPGCTYIFKHALVQDVAYGTLLRGRRQDLHARAGAALETRFPETAAGQPELLAHHFTEAGLIERAVQYCQKGGQQALARSAMTEAEALLRRGLRLLPYLPEGPRPQHELELQVALAPVLTAVQGPGAPAAFEANSRARQLCDELGRADKLLSPLSGLWLYHYVQVDLERAQQLAHEMRQLGELRNDLAMRFTARRAGGTVCFFRGELAAARSELEEGLALYDPAQRASLALAISAVDPLVDVLSVLAGTLAFEGHLEEARSRCEAALSEARRLSHAHTLGFALMWACLVCWIPRWHARVLRFAEEVIALAGERRFPVFRSAGLASRGWCLTASGQADEGVSLLSAALADLQGIAPIVRNAWALPMLADAHTKASRPRVALKRVADLEGVIAATRAELFLSEALRLRAELQVVGKSCTMAEATLRSAIAVAQRQQAKLFELRASASLARLWRDQGRSADAHDLLAPIYDWFTEGFEAPDLLEAKALLDELGATRGHRPVAATPEKPRL